MRKIKKMQADHLYLIRGSSVANSAFFEHEDDCREFLALADHYLEEYLTITSFQNNRDGWVMIIATKSAAAIKAAYQVRRAKSKKCKKQFELKEVWRMLSDQIRIFLSRYVKYTNFKTGRKGAKVRHRYERFLFEDEAEALERQDKLAEEYYPLEQPEERYRPTDEQSTLTKEMIGVSLYMSCALLSIPQQLRKLGMLCLDLGFLRTTVAGKMIKATLHHHFPT